MSYSLRGTTLGQGPSLGGVGDWVDEVGEYLWPTTPTCPIGQTWDTVTGQCVKSAISYLCSGSMVYDNDKGECVMPPQTPSATLLTDAEQLACGKAGGVVDPSVTFCAFPPTPVKTTTKVVTKPDGTKVTVEVPVEESGIDLTTVALLALVAGGGYLVWKKKARGY